MADTKSIKITAPASPTLEHKLGVNVRLRTEPIIIVIKLMTCVIEGVIFKLSFQNSV